MLRELKSFLFRGEVITLAVAVIIGGAFQKIVDSLVENIINPLMSLFTGGANFEESWQVKLGENAFKFGAFFQAIINFVVIGVVLFFLIRAAGKKAEDVQ